MELKNKKSCADDNKISIDCALTGVSKQNLFTNIRVNYF